MRWGPRRRRIDDFLRSLPPRRRRPNLLLLVLLTATRWRRELVLAVGVPWSLHVLAVATHPIAAAAMALVGLVGMFWWEPGRAFVKERAHAVLLEHRLRVGMVEAGIVSWSGRWLPAVLTSRPVTRGVRLTVWCQAGVDVTAFLANRELLAAACWASGIEVARHPRRAQLVTILVVTHPEKGVEA
jgi:hypothetical protein